MNIVGKILVILNLLLALVVGGFLVIDFATRENWKKAYDDLSRELQVAKVNNQTLIKTLNDREAEVGQAKAEADAERSKVAEIEAMHKAEASSLYLKIEEEKQKAREADLVSQKALAEAERLKEENKTLYKTVEDRDQRIVNVQKDLAEAKQAAAAKEREANTMKGRNEELLRQIEQMQERIAKLETDGASGSTGVVARRANAVNPPPAFVKGKIEKVVPNDRTLVQIDIGSDDGVSKGHTLEVYRLNPPKYLGTLQIVDANHHKALGRLMRNGGLAPDLREGDIVSSTIQPASANDLRR